jgi:hypothetical protein
MISSNFANSSAENCAMDFSISASVLSRINITAHPLGEAPLFYFSMPPLSQDRSAVMIATLDHDEPRSVFSRFIQVESNNAARGLSIPR